MKAYRWWFWISVLGLLVFGCATQAPQWHIINPTERLGFDGFSVLPPQGNNWYLGKSPNYGVVFMKRLFEAPRRPEMHTFYAAVNRHDLKGKELKSPQDLLSYVESTFRVEPRFRVVNSKVVLDDGMGNTVGTDCARYDFVQEERGNPIAPEAVLILKAHGFQCRHPSSPTVVINAGCSERYPQGEQSLLDESLKQECESFLRNVLLKPLGRQIATPAVPQAWEAAQWERMILAAKQAREQSNKADAERLCSQALSYVDASAVKSLYEYAELLSAQNRGDGAEVRAKADKLRESKIQAAQATRPGSTYLGFAPGDELNEYAALLQELHRGAEAEAMRALSEAYKYAQQAHGARSILFMQGKDPRGEC